MSNLTKACLRVIGCEKGPNPCEIKHTTGVQLECGLKLILLSPDVRTGYERVALGAM